MRKQIVSLVLGAITGVLVMLVAVVMIPMIIENRQLAESNTGMTKTAERKVEQTMNYSRSKTPSYFPVFS